MEQYTKEKRIQQARGLAIVAVVIIHSGPDVAIASLIVRSAVNFCVGLFLFLSGYLTSVDKVLINPYSFCGRRILRVMIPYTIWSVIVSAVNGTLQDLPRNIITFQSLKSYYYIGVYIQLVILTPVISWLLSRHRINGWLIMSITPISLGVMYAQILLGKRVISPWHYQWFFVWIIYYVFGMQMKLREIQNNAIKDMMILLALFTIQILEGGLWYKYGNHFSINTAYELACSQIKFSSLIQTMFICWLICTYIKKEKNDKSSFWGLILKVLGDLSFGIYLIHLPVLGVVNRVCQLIGVKKTPFPLKSIIVIILSCMFLFVIRKLTPKSFWKIVGAE